MRNIFVFILVIFLSSCDETTNVEKGRMLPEHMEYSYDCLITNSSASKINSFLKKADDMLNEIASDKINITDREQSEYGEKFYKEARKDKSLKINNNDQLNTKLNLILTDLLRVRSNPSSIKYKIYLLDDPKMVNAFTVGGQIFVSRGIMNKCKNDDQLYAIIGHEVGHNEKGHIKLFLQQLKASEEYFGDWGNSLVMIKKFITMSFNQKKELEADYYGIDLTWKLGFDVCAIKSFWDELARSENHNLFEDMFRSHPYSDLRSQCLKNHIESNFNQICK